MWDAVFDVVLGVHVAGGTVALIAGPVAMTARKGQVVHRSSGRIYAVAMVVTAVAAFCLAFATHNQFLLTIAVFSFFLVFSGWRTLGHAQPCPGHGGRRVDWVVAALTLAFSAGLLASGLRANQDVTTLFFGAGGSVLALRQMRHLSAETRPGAWIVDHMIGMSAAYIATVSAFAVVTLTFLPRPVTFIAPTLIGTPIIAWVATRLTRALRGGQPPSSRADRAASLPPA